MEAINTITKTIHKFAMEYGYNQWFIAIGISLLFLWFTFQAFKPKNKTDWKSYGAFSAFIVALFAEMYGFPLSIYLLISWFGNKFPQLTLTHSGGHLLEILLGNKGDPHFSLFHIISNVFIIGGLFLIADAWKILYAAVQKNSLAVEGPYRYIRHPQYAGFIAIIIGFLLQWPTVPTLMLAPLLIYRYIRLTKSEELQMHKQFGTTYIQYKKETPGFFPSIKTLYRERR